MKHKILAVCLSLGLVMGLAGCGQKAAQNQDPAKQVDSETAAGVSNGTLNDDSKVIAVGKTTVLNREYKAYYYFMKNQYENVLSNNIWSYKESGKSIGQEAVEDVVRLIIQVKVICKAAGQQSVSLAADEKEKADYNAKTYLASLDDKVKQENGLDETVVTQIFEENKLAEKMYNVVAGKAVASLANEQLQAVKVQMLKLSYTADTKEKIRAKATQLQQQIASGPNSFYVVAKANTEADSVEKIIGTKDEYTNVVKTALAMKKGEDSKVIEEKDAFYLVHVLQPSSKSLNDSYKNQLVSQTQTKAFQDDYNSWVGQYGVRVSKTLLADK